MSLSDTKNNEFKPIDVTSLETFNEEQSNKTKETNPEFDRFEMLFEKPKFETEETYQFESIYDVKKELEEIIFKPLIEPKNETGKIDESVKEDTDSENIDASIEKKPEEPEETPEEKGYREGFEKGREQGNAEGQKQGYEEGFKKGESDGLEKGKTQGLEQGEKQGLEKGLKDGEEKATEEIKEKAIEILNSLEESLKAADQTLELLVEKYEERIILLIQKIAQKVVLAQVEINDEIVKNLILDALKMLVKPEEVTLSISQDDYEYIEMIKDDFFDQIDSLNSMSVRSDHSIKRGGCKIETVTASVSADPESKLEAIFNALKDAGI